MKLVTFIYQGKEQAGVLHSDGRRVAPLTMLGMPWSDMNSLICEATEKEMEALRHADDKDFVLNAGDLKLLSPIPHPLQDVICLGLNYTEHAEEAAVYSREAFVKKDRK